MFIYRGVIMNVDNLNKYQQFFHLQLINFQNYDDILIDYFLIVPNLLFSQL